MTWTDVDPGAGDTEGLRAAWRALDSATSSLSSAHFDITSEVGTLTDAAWAGEAGEAWRASAETCLQDLGGLVEAAIAGGSALIRYANEVDEIAELAVQVRGRQQDARAGMALVLRQVMPTSLPATPVLTPREQQREHRRRQEARDAAQDAVSAADREMAELVARRAAADTVVREAVGAVEIADWAAIGKASVTAGLMRPGMVGGAATRDVLTSLARDVLDGNAPVEDLMQLLDAWGSDEEVLSAFFRLLGGAGTVALVEVLAGQVYAGTVTEDVARRQAEGLLAALSVASASWTPGQARRFTEQMTEHGRWPGAVGFLFSSAATAPMGQSFTVAVADHLDDYERVHGILPQWQPSDGHVLAHVLFPDGPGRGTEPMSGVLETLGRYPQAALDWLLEGRESPPFSRVDYWVGERDWSGDGFHGVAALWSGLQELPGGPLEVARHDAQSWRTLAIMNTAFGRALCSNQNALPEKFSAEAQVHVAVALGRMMPLLAYSAEADPSGVGTHYLASIYSMGGLGPDDFENRPVPMLDRAHIAELFGMAGSTTAGREVLLAAVRHVQQGMMNTAVMAGGPGIDSVFDRVSSLQALLDGALVGSVDGIADRAVERAGVLVDNAFGLISVVPIPGTGLAADTLAKSAGSVLSDRIARGVADAVVGAVRSAATDRILATVQEAASAESAAGATSGTWVASIGEFDAAKDAKTGRDSLKSALGGWTEYLDMTQSSLWERNDNLDKYLDARTGNYGDIFATASGRAATGAG